MTAQAPEWLFYEDQDLYLYDEPLLYYLAAQDPTPQFVFELVSTTGSEDAADNRQLFATITLLDARAFSAGFSATQPDPPA
jgi:hypothetical protein